MLQIQISLKRQLVFGWLTATNNHDNIIDTKNNNSNSNNDNDIIMKFRRASPKTNSSHCFYGQNLVKIPPMCEI